jgi:hypothetical protein
LLAAKLNPKSTFNERNKFYQTKYTKKTPIVSWFSND